MTKNYKRIKRNIKHQFYYLPYPTFLTMKVINDKTLYKCFICSKCFPTKSRLSRHFTQTNCLKKNKTISSFINRKKNNIINNDTSFNKSSIIFIENKFKEKNIEISTLSQKITNASLIEDNSTITQKNQMNIHFPNYLIKKEFIYNNKDFIGEGHYGKVYYGKFINSQTLSAIKEIKYLSKNNGSEIAILKRLKGLKGFPILLIMSRKTGENLFFKIYADLRLINYIFYVEINSLTQLY